MDFQDWNQEVKKNFDNAAIDYLNYSNIQKFFAEKIICYLKEFNVQKGKWIDLGSGPGLLADEIEKEFTSQKVSRIDFSRKMLFQNKPLSKKLLWDLNNELPSSIKNCDLLTSNFCIHWLKDPEIIIKNWFTRLRSGGYLVITYPTKESFPEWRETCKKVNFKYSGHSFLCPEKLSKDFKPDEIFFSEKFIYLERFPDVYKLFKSIINIGAQSSKSKRKTVKELKTMQKFWPRNYDGTVNLTWEICIQIIKKL